MRPAVDEDGIPIRDPEHPDFKTLMVLDHAGNVPALGQADDLFRWRLDDKQEAAANWSKDPRSGEEKDSVSHTCEKCFHIFSQSRVCPKCGWKVPFSKKDVEVVEADLVLIGKKLVERLPEGFPTHEVFFAMLAHHGNSKRFKPGWPLAMYKEKCGEWPPRHWGGMAMVPPNKRVQNWIRSRQIAYAARKKAEAANSVPC